MSDLFDGIGTASAGGLFARALEPDSGAKSPHPHQPAACLNCGTPLTGAYCHACGQQGHVHRTIGAFMHDLLHGALHFEGKLWRTLPMLTFRPGQLTRRYIDGERARFVSPMALFLFTVFLMFAVFQVAGISTPTSFDTDNSFARGMRDGMAENSAIQVGGDVATEARTADTTTGAADGATGETDEEGAPLPEAIAEVESERDRLRDVLASLPADSPRRAELETELAGTQRALDLLLGARGIVNPGSNAGGFTPTGETGWAFLDAINDKWRENPGLMLYKLQANAYKFSWVLIPISIPFVWLLFAWKRRFKAYDHAIFVTYSLSFVTLLFIALSVLGVAGVYSWILMSIASIVPPIHLYKQLKYTYDVSRFSAFWRLLVLSLFIWIIIALFVQMLVVLGGL